MDGGDTGWIVGTLDGWWWRTNSNVHTEAGAIMAIPAKTHRASPLPNTISKSVSP
jgi:hypothetical protein